MRVSIKANTYVFLTVLLFLIPVRWIVTWLIAIVFHEFCHWLAVKLCGGNVYELEIGLSGAEMQCSNMTDTCRLFSVLCGPVGGLLLIVFRQWIPEIALCSLALSIYNLIPLLPLDGGRAVQILTKGNRAFLVIERLTLVFLCLFGFYSAFYLRLGALPLVIVAGLWIKNRKTPCKEDICRVQ